MEALKKIYQKFRKLLDFRTLIPRIKNKLLKYQYYSMYRKEKVKPNTVFYQAYRPKIMSGNPYAIFKEMIEDPKYDNYIHYWAYGEDVVLESETCKRYRNHPRVKFIKGNTKEYMRALATCEYLVNNAALPSYWIKRPEQIYLNTWHGTPLKTLGRDAKDRSDASISNAQRNFFMCDYMIMPNAYTTQKMLYAYGLRGLIEGRIVEAGYPRVDLVLNTDQAAIRKWLENKAGLSLKDKKIVLYAPTFRSEKGISVDKSQEASAYIKDMASRMPEGYVMFCKIHNMLFQYFADNEELKRTLLLDELDTNELLSVVDVLITDYSSVYFDYLCTRKPILFFVYDRSEYENGHGLYIPMEELPGALCYTVDDVLEQIEAVKAGTYDYRENYDKCMEQFAYLDDGHASKRILDLVFEGKGEQYCHSSRCEKPRMLIHSGNLAVPRDKELCLMLLRRLDYEKYEVYMCGTDILQYADEFNEINKGIQIISAPKAWTATLGEGVVRRMQGIFGRPTYHEREIADRQMRLLFDELKFEVVINLSKAALSWHTICQYMDCKKRVMVASYTEKMWEKFEQYMDGYDVNYIVGVPEEEQERFSHSKIVCVDDCEVYREKPTSKYKVAFLCGFDSTNYVYINVIKELKRRGHEVMVVVRDYSDEMNLKMFHKNRIPLISVAALKINDFVNVSFAVTGPIKLNGFQKVYGFINRLSTTTITFSSLFSSIAMRVYPDITFCLGESKFEEYRENYLKYNMLAIGNPQYDDLIDFKAERAERSRIQKVLIIDQGAYPFGEEGKTQMGRLIAQLARNNEEYQFVLKPRYLPDEQGKQLHRLSEHLYDYITDRPDNLTLLDKPVILEDIMQEMDAVVTFWSTAYLDAAMMELPLVLIEGFASVDVFDVRNQRVAESYEHLRATGCVIDYQTAMNEKLQFHKVDRKYLEKEVYHPDEKSSEKVCNALDYIYDRILMENKRIFRMEPMTYEELISGRKQIETLDKDSWAYKNNIRFRRLFNGLMQEYVYINRCMAKPLSFECFYPYWDEEFSAEERDDRVEKLIEKISVEYNGIMESYFKEHYREVVTDPILCDYYVEWCLKNKKYRWISELEKEPAANPISLVYAKWVKSYRRGRYRRAVSYMERYRDMAEQLEVKNIRKSRSFLVDDITNRFMDYRVFKEIYRADSLPLMEALYNLGRFKAEYRTYYWMLLNQRHGNIQVAKDAYTAIQKKKPRSRLERKYSKKCKELYHKLESM